jgi:hypothetical protein
MSENNIHVMCDKCGKIMRITRFDWVNGLVLIDVEPCTCVHYEKMKKFDKEVGKVIKE